jgi:hypothetical protein
VKLLTKAKSRFTLKTKLNLEKNLNSKQFSKTDKLQTFLLCKLQIRRHPDDFAQWRLWFEFHEAFQFFHERFAAACFRPTGTTENSPQFQLRVKAQ